LEHSSWQKILPQELVTDTFLPGTISFVSKWRMVYQKIVRTNENDADIFTENLNKESYEKHVIKFLRK
jgi:hypothetical protein